MLLIALPIAYLVHYTVSFLGAGSAGKSLLETKLRKKEKGKGVLLITLDSLSEMG